MYCFHHTIRIYFISFIVQISPFVHLFTLKIVYRWGGGGASPLEPPTKALPWICWGLNRPPDPSPQLVPTFHFIPTCSYAPDFGSLYTKKMLGVLD